MVASISNIIGDELLLFQLTNSSLTDGKLVEMITERKNTKKMLERFEEEQKEIEARAEEIRKDQQSKRGRLCPHGTHLSLGGRPRPWGRTLSLGGRPHKKNLSSFLRFGVGNTQTKFGDVVCECIMYSVCCVWVLCGLCVCCVCILCCVLYVCVCCVMCVCVLYKIIS